MVALAPSLNIVKRRRRSPANAEKFDCGAQGFLTVREIMARTGMKEGTVRTRIRRGHRGDELFVRYLPKRLTDSPVYPVAQLATELALTYPGRAPTPEEVMALRPMSLWNAERWSRAIRRVYNRRAA